MAGRDIWTRLRQLDAYPKTLEDFRIKTFSGATGESAISIDKYIEMLVFFCEVISLVHVDCLR